MSDVLPEAVRKGLEAARKADLHRHDRLCLHDGEDIYRITRFWADGLAIAETRCGRLRGRVDIYDGPRFLYQCLIENGRAEAGEWVFDFKWLHPVRKDAPADFVRPDVVPVALLR